jgi:hypothetical protein
MAAPSPEPRGVAARPVQAARASRRDQRLSQAERLQLASEIVAAYVQARRALRRLPIEQVVVSLRASQPSTLDPVGAEALPEARRLGRAVTRMLALVPGDTRCLVRSLVLTRLLAKRGVPAKLVIGARSSPDFLAHAWVEHGGDPVLDPGDGSFGRLVEL